MKKINKDEDQINALKLVANVLSLDEISRVTGVRLELLRRFINRTANDAKAETWDKLYPVLKPYLTGQEEVPPPKRIGPGYRRHAELVEMVSDQKVLLDAFCILSAEKKKKACKLISKEIHGEWKPSAFESLTEDENCLMGAYLALPEEAREEKVLQVVRLAQEEMKNIRRSQNSSGEL